MLENIRAMIFDMDGTLLDSMWAWRGENRMFLKRHGYPVPADLEGGIDTLSSHAFAKRFSQEHAESGFTVESVMAEYIDSMKVHYKTDVFPKKGAERLLKLLKEKGIKLCVATATPRDIAREALSQHGLDGYFDFITDDMEMGVSKGHPEFFDLIAGRLGVQKNECAIFEDSLYAIKSALKAGLSAFGIEDGVHVNNAEMMSALRENTDLFVKDFDEACESFA